ncbi:MAG TPA: hypothetical protein VH134_11950 [Candidatus Dormibacteraeota bacterium]|nr:hypothetical protein [Candidatus Dormibacteraeota bacterium]
MTTPAPPPAAPAPLPPLPDRLEPDGLRELDDAALDAAAAELTAAERATTAAMSPYESQLRELRARRAELATERRRRERAQRHAQRIEVRRAAGTGEMPTLADFLAAAESALPDERPLRDVHAFLATGGEVGFGYPNRPGIIGFTDGRRTGQATTVGDARRLWGDGWEPGAPGVPGVRVHLAGTRIEKVVAPDGVVVQTVEGGTEPPLES